MLGLPTPMPGRAIAAAGALVGTAVKLAGAVVRLRDAAMPPGDAALSTEEPLAAPTADRIDAASIARVPCTGFSSDPGNIDPIGVPTADSEL